MEHDGFPLKGRQIQRADVYRGGVKTRTLCDICNTRSNRTRGPTRAMVSASPDKDVYDNLSSMQVKAAL
jgi:hypothetical protein